MQLSSVSPGAVWACSLMPLPWNCARMLDKNEICLTLRFAAPSSRPMPRGSLEGRVSDAGTGRMFSIEDTIWDSQRNVCNTHRQLGCLVQAGSLLTNLFAGHAGNVLFNS